MSKSRSNTKKMRGKQASPASRYKERGFSLKTHWHNIYFAINALVWTGLILLLALFYPGAFRVTPLLILIGACAAISVVSSSVLLRPGHRTTGVVAQIASWALFLGASLLFFKGILRVFLTVFLPAAALSTGALALLGLLSLRREQELERAMRR